MQNNINILIIVMYNIMYIINRWIMEVSHMIRKQIYIEKHQEKNLKDIAVLSGMSETEK
ncbi:MAG: hypothetical protein AB1765_03875 [Candidatus Hydrogenedentota bacterium]